MKARQLDLFQTIQSEENADFQNRPLLKKATQEFKALGRQEKLVVDSTKNPNYFTVTKKDDYDHIINRYSVHVLKRNKSNNKFSIRISLKEGKDKYIPIKKWDDDPKGVLPHNSTEYHDFQDVVTQFIDRQEAIAKSIKEDDDNMLQELSEQDL
jgi:poly-D-alanine transfer protein DltD